MPQHPTPEIFDSWDSLEGMAHISLPSNARSVRRLGHWTLAWLGELAPGFFLAVGLAYLANGAADLIGRTLFGARVNPISGIPIAIALGIVLCNAVGIPTVFQEGLHSCMRPLQRLAIMLLGWRLSLGVVGGTLVVVSAVAVALLRSGYKIRS